MVSFAAPPIRASSSVPPLSVSDEGLPVRISFPAPPFSTVGPDAFDASMVSIPSPPLIVLSEPDTMIVSLPAPALMTLFEPVTQITSLPDVLVTVVFEAETFNVQSIEVAETMVLRPAIEITFRATTTPATGWRNRSFMAASKASYSARILVETYHLPFRQTPPLPLKPMARCCDRIPIREKSKHAFHTFTETPATAPSMLRFGLAHQPR